MFVCFHKHKFGRWKGIEKRHARGPQCVWLTYANKYQSLTSSASRNARDSNERGEDGPFVARRYQHLLDVEAEAAL